MSASSKAHAGGTAKPASKPTLDWVGTSLLTARTITAAAECAPFPYIKGVFATVVILLETIEKVKKNREDLKELCDDSLEIIKIVRDQISAHGNSAAVKFKDLCTDLEKCLQDILIALEPLQKKPQGFRARFREVLRLNSTAEWIMGHRNKIQTLRLNFVTNRPLKTLVAYGDNGHQFPDA
ncbi:hypothetical protein B0H19DRAFT_1290623 [Mycena capillaripes]|nr:hypothetical protein B0H19DRAFT_1290623 [Mycena capillaripes]